MWDGDPESPKCVKHNIRCIAPQFYAWFAIVCRSAISVCLNHQVSGATFFHKDARMNSSSTFWSDWALTENSHWILSFSHRKCIRFSYEQRFETCIVPNIHVLQTHNYKTNISQEKRDEYREARHQMTEERGRIKVRGVNYLATLHCSLATDRSM